MFFIKLFKMDYDSKFAKLLKSISILFFGIFLTFLLLFILILCTAPEFYILIYLAISISSIILSLLFISIADTYNTVDLILIKLKNMDKKIYNSYNDYYELDEFEKVKILYMYKQLLEDKIIDEPTFEEKKKELLDL